MSDTHNRGIHVHRIYDRDNIPEGERWLVDRLWPRGIRKEAVRLTGWAKEAAPSTELRQWYGHDPAKWPEFRRRYFAELDNRHQAWQPLFAAAARGSVVFLYSSKETELNNAAALKTYIQSKLGGRHDPN